MKGRVWDVLAKMAEQLCKTYSYLNQGIDVSVFSSEAFILRGQKAVKVNFQICSIARPKAAIYIYIYDEI